MMVRDSWDRVRGLDRKTRERVELLVVRTRFTGLGIIFLTSRIIPNDQMSLIINAKKNMFHILHYRKFAFIKTNNVLIISLSLLYTEASVLSHFNLTRMLQSWH